MSTSKSKTGEEATAHPKGKVVLVGKPEKPAPVKPIEPTARGRAVSTPAAKAKKR